MLDRVRRQFADDEANVGNQVREVVCDEVHPHEVASHECADRLSNQNHLMRPVGILGHFRPIGPWRQ